MSFMGIFSFGQAYNERGEMKHILHSNSYSFEPLQAKK